MEDLVLNCYEALTVLLPFIIVFKILKRKEQRQVSIFRFLAIGVFAIYIFAIFHFTGSGTIFDILGNATKPYYSGKYNLVPFSNDIDIITYLQNVLLFMPFGFLLPLLWPNTGKLKYTLFAALSLSFLIEISQYFSFRATDVDDLIMNTIGALLGYAIYRLFANVTKWERKQFDCAKNEPYIYIGAMFLGHFLLYNPLGLRILIWGF